MVRQAEVVELWNQDMTPGEIADALDIQVNGVYNHLRRAGLSGRGRMPRSKEAETVTPPEPTPIQVGSELTPLNAIEDIRMRTADLVEHLESEIAIKESAVRGLGEDLIQLSEQHRILVGTLQSLSGTLADVPEAFPTQIRKDGDPEDDDAWETEPWRAVSESAVSE